MFHSRYAIDAGYANYSMLARYFIHTIHGNWSHTTLKLLSLKTIQDFLKSSNIDGHLMDLLHLKLCTPITV